MSRWRAARSDRGSASVWVAMLGLVLLTAGLVAAGLGAAHVARHEARSAADLAALAGAVHAVAGQETACAYAERIVVANGARLARCRVDGLDLTVTVERTATRLWPVDFGPARPATATARAGPVRADDSRVPAPPAGSGPPAVTSGRPGGVVSAGEGMDPAVNGGRRHHTGAQRTMS